MSFKVLRELNAKEISILEEKKELEAKMAALYATKTGTDLSRRVEEQRLIERFVQLEETMDECSRSRREHGFGVFCDAPPLCMPPLAEAGGFDPEVASPRAAALDVVFPRAAEPEPEPVTVRPREDIDAELEKAIWSDREEEEQSDEEDSFISDDETSSESISDDGNEEEEEDEPPAKRGRSELSGGRVLRDRAKCTKLARPVDCIKAALAGNIAHMSRLMNAKVFYLTPVSSFGFSGKTQIITFHAFVDLAKQAAIKLFEVDAATNDFGTCLMCNTKKHLQFDVYNSQAGQVIGSVGSTCANRIQATIDAGKFFAELKQLAENDPEPSAHLDRMLGRYLSLADRVLARVGCT